MATEVATAMAEVATKEVDSRGPNQRAAREICRTETHRMMIASGSRRLWEAVELAIMLAGSSPTSCRRMEGRAVDREPIRHPGATAT